MALVVVRIVLLRHHGTAVVGFGGCFDGDATEVEWYRRLQDDGNTNCPALYGGIRTTASDHCNPFWREAEPYAPYARPTDDDGARAVWVPAYTDFGANPARVGERASTSGPRSSPATAATSRCIASRCAVVLPRLPSQP